MGVTMEKISIIIPTFNRSNFLRRAIDSCIKQTYECEIIVCDHGSIDDTPEVIKKYLDRVRYIRRDENFGPNYTWLDGVLHCNSDLVHIQFDDDWIAPDFIEKTLSMMSDDVGFVFSQVIVCDQNGVEKKQLFPFLPKIIRTGIYKNKKLERLLATGLMISPGACLFRKQTIIDSLYQGNLPLKGSFSYFGVGPDHFMTFMAMLQYPKFGFISEPLAFFREHAGSITVNAVGDEDKSLKIRNAYFSVKYFYKLISLYNNNRLLRIFIMLQSCKLSMIKQMIKKLPIINSIATRKKQG